VIKLSSKNACKNRSLRKMAYQPDYEIVGDLQV